jgi:hypothetical protein
MQDYKKLINDNAVEFQNPDNLIDFLDSYMQDGQEVSDQKDNLCEYADNLVPIYYNDIIEEWKNSQSCHRQASEEGLIEGVTDVYKIMQADLYAMYSQELHADFQTFMDLIDDLPEDEAASE